MCCKLSDSGTHPRSREQGRVTAVRRHREAVGLPHVRGASRAELPSGSREQAYRRTRDVDNWRIRVNTQSSARRGVLVQSSPAQLARGRDDITGGISSKVFCYAHAQRKRRDKQRNSLHGGSSSTTKAKVSAQLIRAAISCKVQLSCGYAQGYTTNHRVEKKSPITY